MVESVHFLVIVNGKKQTTTLSQGLPLDRLKLNDVLEFGAKLVDTLSYDSNGAFDNQH